MSLDSSLVITGPPASGKSRAALERFHTHPDSYLVTPTSTMAEHVRNELARAGFPVRPSKILTLARFLDAQTKLAAASEPVVHLLIREALERLQPSRFLPVAGFREFHCALASLLEEAPVETLGGAFGEDLAKIVRRVSGNLAARGMAPRHERMRTVTPRDLGHVVFDGFFSFSAAELDFVRTIASRSVVTVTLPDGPGAEVARDRLRSAGFAEQRMSQTYRRPVRSVFSTPAIEQETEEIARRILAYAAQGREFREMGIILRTREPYGPVLETTLARFGIPARLYFTRPIALNPAVRFLSGVIEGLLRGWDHAELAALLRMPVSGVGATEEGDRFDFELRKLLPGAGLPLHGIGKAPPVLDSLAKLDPWRRERLEAEGWAVRLKSLTDLLPATAPVDQVAQDQIHAWRSTAVALQAFNETLDAAAVALGSAERISLAEFWKQAELALSLEPLRVPDGRRNVVHVVDVFEARQWELPIVFVCGLEERHFPQYHREDPLLNDASRRGFGLPTTADLRAQEKFLFEIATTRSTGYLVLSYSRFNARGEDALPSFFLQNDPAAPCQTLVRPKPSRETAPPPFSIIQDAPLLAQLAEKHQTLSATSIESFLQCPFQFFGRKTLRLRERPPAPRDRLTLLLQGSIIHRALAEGDFGPVFDDEIRRARVPETYRTEAVRLELLRYFEAFFEDRSFSLGWETRVEQPFRFPLTPALTVSGRIDRMDVGPENQALVIDYKYSAGAKIRERVEESSAGNLVQGGLYLLAAGREFGLTPAGMLFCGLKKGVVWGGWHVFVPGLEAIGESRTPSGLEELMDQAKRHAIEVFESIAAGRTAPTPADRSKCKWCDYRDICRIATEAETLQAASG